MFTKQMSGFSIPFHLYTFLMNTQKQAVTILLAVWETCMYPNTGMICQYRVYVGTLSCCTYQTCMYPSDGQTAA